jgi:O-antigen ligase
MSVAAADPRLKFHLLIWYGIIGLTALILGYFLAANVTTIFLMVSGVAWLMLLPYHAQLSFYLAMGTFNSALILPFLPGRPYLWEFAALLAWTGVVMTVSLRRAQSDFYTLFRRNSLLFWASLGYCLVLGVTMFFRGFGLRILGSGQMGGRFYIQQLMCAIFPLLFIMVRTNERMLVRLFIVQSLLTCTYLVSDFVFSIASPRLFVLLEFFELPNDALNFELQSMRFGIRRFQSLAIFGQGFIFFMLIFYNLREFFSRRGLWLLPIASGVFGLSLLSGHRWVVLIVGVTLLFCGYAQRFFTTKNLLIGLTVLMLAVGVLYAVAQELPGAFQRSISFLPGINIQHQARSDAASTMWARRVLFSIGLDMIPEYFWVGRGFARYVDDYSSFWDPTTITFHINQGKFYNGFIGLMVNTGFFGTVSMIAFMFAGSRVAWNVMRHLRTYGCEDHFSRVCCIVTGLWLANVLAFLFLHGDSEWAMKTFSLQAGILLACEHQLSKRLTQAVPGRA